MQKLLACPGVKWNWEKFDLETIGNLYILLGDEFLDGTQTKSSIEYKTAYETLKGLRKAYKYASHTKKWDTLQAWFDKNPTWLVQFKPYYDLSALFTDQLAYCQSVGILSQSRGCGTPPPCVIAKSKMKFLNVIQEPAVPISSLRYSLIQVALKRILSRVPDYAFTGLQFGARVNVTGSASLEHTRKDGGTLRTIRDILDLATEGRKAHIVDLETGERISSKTLEEISEGEYIFYRCLEVVLSTPPEELRVAYGLVVKEPGKGRTVTKGPACLKVILDVVSKIVSKPLGKGFPSSSSGMEKSNHGWNFFRDFYRSPMKNKIFETKQVSKVKTNGSFIETRVFETVFVASTDYETATDYLEHKIAQIIGSAWLSKCGIPKLLRGIVKAVCFHDRRIFFKGQGVFEEVGIPTEHEGVREVKMVRGLLMGDPLTKPILHLVNILTREITNLLVEPSALLGVSADLNNEQLLRLISLVISRNRL